jgi:formate hydrogenlyase transcriptional activator
MLSRGFKLCRWYATGTDIEDRKQAEQRMQNENLALRDEIDRSSMYETIVGSSESLRQVLSQFDKVAPADSTVLILGATGTGKELVASAIHKRSKRSAEAFIRVNCTAIPPSLIASELFFHEKGAFTGALQRRAGRFESADGGTIFLDEIGELSPETQLVLLRVLQERELERVGSNQPLPIDVRVVAATNRDLETAAHAGTFRQDLFYRLNVFPIRVPPLREMKNDIPLLVEYLVERHASRAGKTVSHIKKKTLDILQAYDWPGNVRELQNVIERAVILCDGETFSVYETWLRPRSPQRSGRRGIAMPLAGMVAWGVVGVAGAFLPPGPEVWVLFGSTGSILFLGLFFSRFTGRISSISSGRRICSTVYSCTPSPWPCSSMPSPSPSFRRTTHRCL